MNLVKIKSKKELDVLEITSFRDAIRAKCYDCSCYDLNEVKNCTAYKCPLWAFRFGKKPKDGRLAAVSSEVEPQKKQIEAANVLGSTESVSCY